MMGIRRERLIGTVVLGLLVGVACWFPKLLLLSGLFLVQGYVLLSCLHLFLPVAILLLCYYEIKRLFARQPPEDTTTPPTRFVLLVPAHNEERLLPGLLESIRQQHYPAELYTVLIIADNCQDATAAIARQHEVYCLERHTGAISDKTQALRYAARQLPLLRAPFTGAVVCIIDADSKLEHTYLSELDKAFSQPGAAPVMQSYRYVSNTFASNVAMLDAAAEALRQWLLSGTRKLLGMEAFIHGLGCSMRDSVFAELMQLPDYSLAEDKDWKAYLVSRRVRVEFCPTARLSYEVVENGRTFQQQRRRWLAGHWAALRKYGPRMLGQGMYSGRVAQLDFACELLQPPRSVLLLAATAFGVVAVWWREASLVSVGVWGVLVVAFFLYGGLGLWLIKARRQQYLVLFSGISLVLGIAKSMVELVLGKGIRTWEATRKPAPVNGLPASTSR